MKEAPNGASFYFLDVIIEGIPSDHVTCNKSVSSLNLPT